MEQVFYAVAVAGEFGGGEVFNTAHKPVLITRHVASAEYVLGKVFGVRKQSGVDYIAPFHHKAVEVLPFREVVDNT